MPIWVWLVPLLLTPYHFVNIARIFAGRFRGKQLSANILRTFVWIIGVQIIVFAALYGTWRYSDLTVATSILQAAVALALLISTLHMWRHIRPSMLRTPLTDRELPSLSVLVPARDETIDLQNCLTALIASDYPKLEIIALDDCSTNRRTPEIIRGFAHDGVRFIQGNEPPHSMLPKNHAYARLADEASGELLMFIGVDVIVEADSLRRLVEALLADNRDMMSVLPLRPVHEHRKLSFIQAMRYWWELGWPRRIFNRPPVLSTVWLIRAQALERAGGFAAAAQMITPEAYFAKMLVEHDRYSFIRSTPHTIALYSTKDIEHQFETAVRVRYPQLHRRMGLVVLISLFELIFLIGPFILLPVLFVGTHSALFAMLNLTAVLALWTMYYLIAIRTHLNNLWLGLLTAPVAFTLDIIMIHVSMFTYEFGTVTWHDRRLNRPMVEPIDALPRVDS
jgi:chlorobactene glucosyltransferase